MADYSDLAETADQLALIKDLPMDPDEARAAQIAAEQVLAQQAAAGPGAAPAGPTLVVPDAPQAPALDPLFAGLQPAAADAEPPAAPAAVPAAPTPPAPADSQTGQMVPLSRLNEVLEQQRADRQRMEVLERLIIEGRGPAPAAPAAPAATEDPNYDPTVAAYMAPYIERLIQERAVPRTEFDGFRQTLQPVAEQQGIVALGNDLAKVIPGFDPSNAGAVVERLNGITDPQERALYAGSGYGAIMLAQRMVIEGAFAGKGGAPAKPPIPKTPMRPGADVTGTPSRASVPNDESIARQIAEMPQADFDRLLGQQLGGMGSGGFTLDDLLPR